MTTSVCTLRVVFGVDRGILVDREFGDESHHFGLYADIVANGNPYYEELYVEVAPVP